jgi:ribosome-associated protein
MIRSSHGGTTTTPKRGSASASGGGKLPPRRSADPPPATRRSGGVGGPRSRRAATTAAADEATSSGGAGLKKARGGPESRGSLSSSASATRVPAGVSSASDEAREIAVLVAVAAIEKKASGLEVIDVAGRVDYADFLVLMSGRSDRHVTALSSAIEEALRKRNKRALAVEGLPHASWVLMDFGDVVVHVFQDDARAAYDIDGLWMDARRVPVPLSEPRA